jgi:hypothetical protein
MIAGANRGDPIAHMPTSRTKETTTSARAGARKIA